MTFRQHLIPRQPAPDLQLKLVNGARWRLAAQKPKHFTMLAFYRGLHCSICKGYLGELSRMVGDFAERGVEVIAISSDGEMRAQQTHRDWALGALPLGYGLSLEDARKWGLYVSTSRGTTSLGIEEPRLFTEPGLFLVRPDQTLYFASVQTMPFARPSFRDVLGAVDFVLKNNYPARGEVVDIDEGDMKASA